MRTAYLLTALLTCAAAPASATTWAATGWVKFDIRMDNGVTYLYPALPNGSLSYNLGGTCQYNRLQIDNGGDRFSSAENGKRMMAMLLTAKSMGLRVSFGYDTDDGVSCRLAQLYVEWPGSLATP